MSKRFLHPLLKYVCLALSLSAAFIGVNAGFSADAFTVPQTAEVTLAWDPNDPTPEGYRIFQRKEGETYDYSQPVWTGSATTGTVYNLEWNTAYYYVVRAYDSDLESADSEEVSYHSPIPQTATYSIATTAGDHGSISPSGTLDYTEGADQTYTIAPDSGYHIADVLVDGVSQGAIGSYTFSQIGADHTIEALFAANTYTISAAAGDNGSINPVGESQVTHGDSRTYTIAPDNGFRIANVLVDGVAQGVIPSYTFENVTSDHTITATFAVNTYTISATAGGNGSISPSGSTQVTHGGSQTYTITPASGYHIAEVLIDGASVGAIGAYTFTGVAANHNIHATFSVDTFTIAASADANGRITPSGIVAVDYGDSQTFSIAPDSGYHVVDVIVDGVSQGALTSYTFNQLAASHSIRASFAVNTYTISASAGTNGSISPSGSTQVAHGGSQTYAILPAQGYLVADVLVNGTSQGPISTYTFNQVTNDQSIVASFVLEETYFTISSSAGTNGRISPDGSTSVSNGASQTYTITPDAGYHVANVAVDGLSVGALPSYTFNDITSNHTITATFEADTFVISATAGEGGGISPSGQIAVERGGSQVFTLTANEGYGIQDLVVNGLSQGAVDTYTLQNITANCSVEARFSASNQAPMADAGPDQKVDEGQMVTLSGLNSIDPDDGIATFQWYQVQGDEVVLSSPDQGETQFTAPDVDAMGMSLVFELHVTDFSGETTVDTCIVNVTWVNIPPTADAGQTQTVNEGAAVTLEATGSVDPDDGIVQYRWQQIQGPEVELSGDQSAVASFTAPDVSSEGGSLVFQVTVTDAGGLQDTDTCLVTVAWANTPPQANAGEDQQVYPGADVTLNGSLSKDSDGDMALSYRWRQTEGAPVELSDATADMPSFVAPEIDGDIQTLTFELTVTDSEGMLDKDTCQVVVTAPSDVEADTTAPVLTVENPASSSITVGWFYINMSGSAWDDTGVQKVTWKNNRGGSGVAVGTERWSVNAIRLKYGTNVITLTATDAAGNTTSVTRTVVLRFRWWW